MNMFKKLMKGVMTGALALTVIAGIGTVSASAESLEVGAGKAVTVGDRQITVNPNAADTFYVAFPTVKDGKATIKSWEVYATGVTSTKIDLSNLNATKDNYVAIKTAKKAEPVIIHFPANTAKLKITCTLQENGTPDLTIENKGKDGKTYEAQNIDFRVGANGGLVLANGITQDYDLLAMQGATIYASVAPSDKVEAAKENITDKADDAIVYKTYEAPILRGVTAKFKVAKKANAPKVNIDYTKRVLKISDKMEYATVNTESYKAGDYTPGSKEGVDAPKQTTLFVRTKANGKKAASKITPVIIGEFQTAPSTKSEAVTYKNDAAEANIATIGEKNVSIALDAAKKNVTIKNGTEATVGIYLGTTEKASDKATKVLKAGATVKVKADLVKDAICVRVEGDNKTKKYASDWAKATLKFEEAATEKTK